MKVLKFCNHIICLLFLPVLFSLPLKGCGTLAGNPEEDEETKKRAPINFSITDAPVDEARHVYITVSSLEVSRQGEKWVVIPLTTETEIDLLALQQGRSLPLGELEDLPIGVYQQTRLRLSSQKPPRLVDVAGVEHPLTIPSAQASGIKIVTPFELREGEPLNLTIDFDLRRSLRRTGQSNNNGNGNANHNGNGAERNMATPKYMMRPVLRLVKNNRTGSVIGNAPKGTTICVYQVGASKDSNTECENSENSAVTTEGRFKVAFLEAGRYDLRVFFGDGNNRDVDGVEVSASVEKEIEVLQ
jgi:hypothetical protein